MPEYTQLSLFGDDPEPKPEPEAREFLRYTADELLDLLPPGRVDIVNVWLANPGVEGVLVCQGGEGLRFVSFGPKGFVVSEEAVALPGVITLPIDGDGPPYFEDCPVLGGYRGGPLPWSEQEDEDDDE